MMNYRKPVIKQNQNKNITMNNKSSSQKQKMIPLENNSKSEKEEVTEEITQEVIEVKENIKIVAPVSSYVAINDNPFKTSFTVRNQGSFDFHKMIDKVITTHFLDFGKNNDSVSKIPRKVSIITSTLINIEANGFTKGVYIEFGDELKVLNKPLYDPIIKSLFCWLLGDVFIKNQPSTYQQVLALLKTFSKKSLGYNCKLLSIEVNLDTWSMNSSQIIINTIEKSKFLEFNLEKELLRLPKVKDTKEEQPEDDDDEEEENEEEEKKDEIKAEEGSIIDQQRKIINSNYYSSFSNTCSTATKSKSQKEIESDIEKANKAKGFDLYFRSIYDDFKVLSMSNVISTIKTCPLAIVQSED